MIGIATTRHRLWVLVLVGGCGSDSTGGATSCALASSGSSATADEVRTSVLAYKAAHPGRGGKDWDINAKTSAELDADAEATALLGLCGEGRRPVIPLIAWEYGGNDHPWIAPEASALVYCDATPIVPSTSSWSYDAGNDQVTADVEVLFPDENPCKDLVGAEQVAGCIGDPSNFEILVDTASYYDGDCAGLSLSEAATELRLVLTDGSKVHLYTD
jgi:hypothetical protein